MEYTKTQCHGCKTKESPLSWIQPMQHKDDFWCDKCKPEEIEKRAKESKIKLSKGWKGQNN